MFSRLLDRGDEMVSKRLATSLMRAWQRRNASQERVQPKQYAYTDVWLMVDQYQVIDERPGAASWQMKNGVVTRKNE